MSVRIKYVRNDGKSFEIDNELYKITELEGWDYPSIGYSMQEYIGRSGGKIQNYRLNNTDRTVVFVLMNKSLIQSERQRILAFFNPKYMFRIYITYQGVTRWCDGKIIAFKNPTENIYKQIEVSVTTISETPYLQSVDEFGKDIAAVEPCAGFPYVSLVEGGFVTGIHDFNKEVLLKNEGHDIAYLKIKINFNGEAINPKISKDDKFIRIIDTFQTGDEVNIDLTQKVPRIVKNGKNIQGKLDKLSKPLEMYLDVGTSTISYSADNGDDNMNVYVYYNQQYLGI